MSTERHSLRREPRLTLTRTQDCVSTSLPARQHSFLGLVAYLFLVAGKEELALLFGSHPAIAENVQQVMIPDFTRAELKGAAYALYSTLMGTGLLAANLTFGAL